MSTLSKESLIFAEDIFTVTNWDRRGGGGVAINGFAFVVSETDQREKSYSFIFKSA
jgi:hypothetical protein